MHLARVLVPSFLRRLRPFAHRFRDPLPLRLQLSNRSSRCRKRDGTSASGREGKGQSQPSES
ncbi:hypothetical protein BT69DRAFT_785007 [Atractiella rhizophila]|nr:hypothetical protein BT69DRAFT_785007 [Atractiella rhizophila]